MLGPPYDNSAHSNPMTQWVSLPFTKHDVQEWWDNTMTTIWAEVWADQNKAGRTIKQRRNSTNLRMWKQNIYTRTIKKKKKTKKKENSCFFTSILPPSHKWIYEKAQGFKLPQLCRSLLILSGKWPMLSACDWSIMNWLILTDT